MERMTPDDWHGWQSFFRLKDRMRRAERGESEAAVHSDPRVAKYLQRVWMDAKTRKAQ